MSGNDEKMMMPPTSGGEGGASRGDRTVAEEGEGLPPPPPPLPLVVATSRDDSAKEAGKAAESRASRERVELESFDSEWDVEDKEDSRSGNGDEVDDENSGAEASADGEEEEYEDPDDTESDPDDDTDEDGEEELGDSVEDLRQLNGNPLENRLVYLDANLGRVPAMAGEPRRQERYRRAFPGHFRDFVTELGRGAHGVGLMELRFANFCQEGWIAPAGRGDAAGSSLEDADDHDDDDDTFGVDVALQPDERDLERMFGTVLPNLACLKVFYVKNSRLQPRFLNSFAESAARNPTFSLESLTIVATPLDAECGRIVKTMLQGNVRLRYLYLQRCGLDADGWRLVCEGAAASRRLELLDLKDDIVLPSGTVAAALDGGSALTHLHVAPRMWSRRAFVELVEALRANTALEEVSLAQKGGFMPAQAGLALDVLRTSNFTLQNVHLVPRKDGTGSHEGPIGALLRRNAGVRRAVEHLGATGYRVSRRAAWPLALRHLSTIPTLLYRFVRRGNVDALAEQAAMGAAPPNERKRRHDQVQLQDVSGT
jgi:hypothetical protein